jgi:hypothetical protein
MASTFLILTLAATVIYILWIIFKPRKNSSKKKPVRKKINKKNHPDLKGKKSKQQTKLPSPDQIRKEKTEQMKKDPELIGRVVRYWLRER